MQFRDVIMAYFVIGAVMFGGGAISWDNVGAASMFVDNDNGNIGGSEESASNLGGIGGAIQSAVNMFLGGLIIAWNLIIGLLAFLHWPITVLDSNNAPPTITILLGGGFTAAFYMSLIGVVIRSS